jgi:transposase InsO family protein
MTPDAARRFLDSLQKATPIKITHILTDNGKAFSDRPFHSNARDPSGKHELDRLCADLGIEHRLTRPRTPQTNGMVERFNGRISDLLKTHHFVSREDLEETPLRYVHLYNHQPPQSALKSKPPIMAMKAWYETHPELFKKRPYNHAGLDT